MRIHPPTSRRSRAAAGLVATLLAALVLTGCTGSSGKQRTYPDGEGLSTRVLPRMASVGDDVEKADDAAWVVEAVLDEPADGREVELWARQDGEWTRADAAETDDAGAVTLRTTTSGPLRVVSEEANEVLGDTVSTDDAPEASFTDDFDEDSLAGAEPTWVTRDQGYFGLRQCSRSTAEAAEVMDGRLRLSVRNDPDKGKCEVKGKRYDYRINGHVGTMGSYTFTHGFAAARIKFQEDRGQHGAFWFQTMNPGSVGPEGGAEIDVAEYFGDGHPQGGLTSFVYSQTKRGEPVMDGGWVENIDEYGADWAQEFHVFSVEWTPTEYVFRIDGQVTHRLEGPTSHEPEFVILSLLSSDYELKHSEKLPQHMDVDWVRVWETDH